MSGVTPSPLANTANGRGARRDNVIGKMLNVAHIAFQHGDFQTVVMVDMYVEGGDGEVVVVMLGGN